MVISKKHGFIFVHIYKNAGTSITTALMPFATSPFQKAANLLCKPLGIRRFDPQPFEDHATASEMIQAMGREQFKSHYSFAFVRNPWDWQVSLYEYMLKIPDHFQHNLVKSFTSFEKYLEWRVNKDLHFQKDFVYSPEGELLVDFVGRFEQLDHDFQQICRRVGISTALEKLNVSKPSGYRDYYCDKTREMVRQAFQPDIQLFNYEY